MFASDQVESLDALRRAEAAFAPLAAELEPPLRQGLATTFENAEAAIVNRSETDLRVQAAVLRGGFQRSLYRAALESAASGDLTRARDLLSVLATDLGMTETAFGGASPQGLQTAFEGRLAALSLTRLERLGDDRESRYETLAGVYGHVFLVQDSPRLPPETQATLLGAIQALVTDKPLAPPLESLRAQLSEFERAARSSRKARPASVAEAAPPTTAPETATASDDVSAGEAATGTAGAAEGPEDALAEIDIAPELTPETVVPPTANTANTVADTTAANADVAVNTTTNTVANTAENTATNTAAPPAPADGAQPAPLNPAAPPNTVTTPLSPNAQLVSGLREPLLLVAGALALIGFLGLLFSRRSPTPWRDAALALLLLPAVAEGLIALAPYVTPLLEPYVTLPNELGSYSLFANLLTQLVWTTLTVLAALCLMLSWRAPGAASRSRPASEAPVPASTAALTPATTSGSRDGAGHAPVQAFPRSSSTLTTGSGFDWDEDF